MTMTVGDLRKALEGVDDGMFVLIRAVHESGDQVFVGGATSAVVDAGCTDVDAFVIDGDEDEITEEG